MDSVWITVDPHTVQRLSTVATQRPDGAIVFPTALRADPYVHFMRDSSGRVTGVSNAGKET